MWTNCICALHDFHNSNNFFKNQRRGDEVRFIDISLGVTVTKEFKKISSEHPGKYILLIY